MEGVHRNLFYEILLKQLVTKKFYGYCRNTIAPVDLEAIFGKQRVSTLRKAYKENASGDIRTIGRELDTWNKHIQYLEMNSLHELEDIYGDYYQMFKDKFNTVFNTGPKHKKRKFDPRMALSSLTDEQFSFVTNEIRRIIEVVEIGNEEKVLKEKIQLYFETLIKQNIEEPEKFRRKNEAYNYLRAYISDLNILANSILQKIVGNINTSDFIFKDTPLKENVFIKIISILDPENDSKKYITRFEFFQEQMKNSSDLILLKKYWSYLTVKDISEEYNITVDEFYIKLVNTLKKIDKEYEKTFGNG
jgi:hypothetical protein